VGGGIKNGKREEPKSCREPFDYFEGKQRKTERPDGGNEVRSSRGRRRLVDYLSKLGRP